MVLWCTTLQHGVTVEGEMPCFWWAQVMQSHLIVAPCVAKRSARLLFNPAFCNTVYQTCPYRIGQENKGDNYTDYTAGSSVRNRTAVVRALNAKHSKWDPNTAVRHDCASCLFPC